MRIETHHRVFAMVAIALFAAGCADDERLTRICPATCYTGPEGTEGIGACKAGTPTCDEEGNILSCDGQVVPEFESRSCDTVDSDCDGDVNDVVAIQPFDSDNRCLQCGKCRQTRERCNGETGEWYCDYPNGPPTPEVCNGLREDEDCDCLTDNEDPDLPGSGPESELVFCYTGPEGTALEGNCSPGYEFCDPLTGEWGCSDTTPQTEDCSGLDMDCNGIRNDAATTFDKVAMVIAIDISGSMGDEKEAVEGVVCDYASQGGTEDYLFALVLIAEPDGAFSLVQNMTDAQGLCEALQNITMSGGTEPTLSAAQAVVDPNNPLLIGWPEGNVKRIFVGFGDEPAAVMDMQTVEDVVTDTLGFCAASETDVYWFVQSPVNYDAQAFGCNGQIFQLTSYEPWMLEDMNTIVESVCFESGAPP